MNGHDLEHAMDFVSQELVDLAEKRRFRPSPWKKVGTIAAALAIMAGIGAGVWRYALPATLTPELSQPEAIPAEPVEVLPVEDELPAESQLPTPEAPEAPEVPEITGIHQLLDPVSLDAYLQAHPEQNAEQLQLNEAGLEQSGTELTTIQGDQVLAIDAANQLLLVRVRGDGYQGVLAICQDPARLRLQPSAGLGEYGQTVGEIAEANGGILAINASRFLDTGRYATHEGEEQPDGSISQDTIPTSDDALVGGIPLGYPVYDGVPFTEFDLGELRTDFPYGRLEISEDGQFHLTQPGDALLTDTRSACSAHPPMLVEGQPQTEAMEGFSNPSPRTCIGQTKDGSVLLLVIEGRLKDRSMGLDIPSCAEILLRYDGWNAIGLQYGSGCMMWYAGAPVTACSNFTLPEGIKLPDAFVIS